MDIPLILTINVTAMIANSVHGAAAFHAQIFAQKAFGAIH